MIINTATFAARDCELHREDGAWFVHWPERVKERIDHPYRKGKKKIVTKLIRSRTPLHDWAPTTLTLQRIKQDMLRAATERDAWDRDMASVRRAK